MSCIIFGYRRFYAIICKITHFFYPKRKNPPLFAHSTLHKAKSVPCTTLPTCAASASPPAAETMTGGEHFRHPGGGGSRAKPRISPRGVVATCGACQIARPQSHPGGGAGLCFRRGAVCIILCTTWLCGAMTACHHLRGGIFGTPFGGPRMSPTPRSAKYGATHSANRLPGLEITSPLVIICRRRSRGDGIQSGTGHLLWSVVVAATQLTCP